MEPARATPVAETRAQPMDRYGTIVALSLIALAGIAAYSNSFRGVFVFDDNVSIRDNETIRRLWPLGPVLTGATTATVAGRPLLNLSLALNYAWGGLDVWGYHAVNLVVHLVAAAILFCLVRRTLLLPTMPASIRSDAWGLSLAVALLWMIHPLQTESVTYVVQRAESIAGAFYFLTLYCVNRAATGTRPKWWSIAAVISCALGTAAKEVVATAPVMAMLYDRVFLAPSFAEIRRRRPGLHLGLASTWLMMAALMISSRGRNGSAGFGLGMSSWDYAMTQFGFIVRYLRLSFWPDALVLDYGSELARTPLDIIPYAIIVAILLAATIIAFRYEPRWGFVGAWFFLILAPSSSIVPLVTQTGAEHRMYLPLLSVVLLAVFGVYFFGRGFAPHAARKVPAWRRLAPVLALAVAVIGLGWRTYARNNDYRSTLAIWKDAAQKWPTNVRAHDTVGREYAGAGKLPQAIQEYDAALRLDPKFTASYFNRGNAYALESKYQRAIQDYDRLIELEPEYSEAYFQRGMAYGLLGKDDQALASFSRAVELRPDHTDARLMCGKIKLHSRRYQEAIVEFTNLIELHPIYHEAYDHRGQCRQQLGDLEQAIEDYTKAIEQQPNSPDAYCHRASAYATARQPELAIADFSKTIALAPHHIAALNGRAVCWFELGRIDNARLDVEVLRSQGIQVNPEFAKKLAAASAHPQ